VAGGCGKRVYEETGAVVGFMLGGCWLPAERRSSIEVLPRCDDDEHDDDEGYDDDDDDGNCGT
jgi:hypothetical protein